MSFARSHCWPCSPGRVSLLLALCTSLALHSASLWLPMTADSRGAVARPRLEMRLRQPSEIGDRQRDPAPLAGGQSVGARPPQPRAAAGRGGAGPIAVPAAVPAAPVPPTIDVAGAKALARSLAIAAPPPPAVVTPTVAHRLAASMAGAVRDAPPVEGRDAAGNHTLRIGRSFCRVALLDVPRHLQDFSLPMQCEVPRS